MHRAQSWCLHRKKPEHHRPRDPPLPPMPSRPQPSRGSAQTHESAHPSPPHLRLPRARSRPFHPCSHRCPHTPSCGNADNPNQPDSQSSHGSPAPRCAPQSQYAQQGVQAQTPLPSRMDVAYGVQPPPTARGTTTMRRQDTREQSISGTATPVSCGLSCIRTPPHDKREPHIAALRYRIADHPKSLSLHRFVAKGTLVTLLKKPELEERVPYGLVR